MKMIGKFFLLALVCVSFAQVEGTGLEDAIQNGLNRAKSLEVNAQTRIDATIKEVEFKSELIQSETSDFVEKSVGVEDEVRQDLRNTAQSLEEKAEEANKPQSVVECIRRIEENSNKQIEIFTNKFEIDMKRLESVKLANIETDSKPLQEKQEALRVRYERAVKLIQNCNTASCVDIAVNSFTNWLDKMFADMSRIQGQVTIIYNKFQSDANNYFENTNRQVTRIHSTALTNMKECLYKERSYFRRVLNQLNSY